MINANQNGNSVKNIPSFLTVFSLYTRNLLTGLFVRSILGVFAASAKERSGIPLLMLDEEYLRIDKVALVGVSLFCRGMIIGQTRFLKRNSDGKINKVRCCKNVALISLSITLTIFMGLVTIPFVILRTSIKLLLLVPRICILRAFAKIDESYKLCTHEDAKESVKTFVKEHLNKLLHSPDIENVDIHHVELPLFTFIPKRVFGPGHAIYMILYHLTFAAALASVPLLLDHFNKLPKEVPFLKGYIPHSITLLHVSLGLIALLSIISITVNTVQYLEINSRLRNFARGSLQYAIDTHLNFVKKILILRSKRGDFSLNTAAGLMEDRLCQYDALVNDFINKIYRLHDNILFGNNFCWKSAGDHAALRGRGIPVMSLDDMTTDVGLILEFLTTCIPSFIIRFLYRKNHLVQSEERMEEDDIMKDDAIVPAHNTEEELAEKNLKQLLSFAKTSAAHPLDEVDSYWEDDQGFQGEPSHSLTSNGLSSLTSNDSSMPTDKKDSAADDKVDRMGSRIGISEKSIFERTKVTPELWRIPHGQSLSLQDQSLSLQDQSDKSGLSRTT